MQADHRRRNRLDTLILVGCLSLWLLVGCALGEAGDRPCPPSKMLVKVERTAAQPSYRCVLKADVKALFDRPTDNGRRD